MPNYQAARALVERVSQELGIAVDLRMVEVPDLEAAERMRFLGSPTVRVDGQDVEPGADAREQFVLACRIYRGEAGFGGLPDERWLRAALTGG